MFAITMDSFGGPEVLRWAEMPAPQPGPGEVLIRVQAAGVNRADLLQRQGHYPPPAGASEVLGLECGGVVTEVDGAVAGWNVGDRVCALLAGGGYAEQVAVPAGQLLPMPSNLDFTEAAALPEVVATVWSNLALTAGLSAGETVLIHGGAGGIGTMAIQLAKAMGATVAVTAGSDERLAACRRWGSDIEINYRTQDFGRVLAEATDGRGADVILDVMGAKYLEQNVAALADGGRLVIIGMQGGTKAELNIAALLSGRKSVAATALRSRPVTGKGSKAEVIAAVRRQVWPWIAQGRVRPVVGAVIPLPEAARAHELLTSGQAPVGKIVLAS